jgi:hypothetical protein
MGVIRMHINAGGGYDVTVGRGLLESCGDAIGRTMGPCRIAVITDSVVEKLYLDPAARSLAAAGFEVSVFSFPAGENRKTSKRLRTFSNSWPKKGLPARTASPRWEGGSPEIWPALPPDVTCAGSAISSFRPHYSQPWTPPLAERQP